MEKESNIVPKSVSADKPIFLEHSYLLQIMQFADDIARVNAFDGCHSLSYVYNLLLHSYLLIHVFSI